MTLRERQKQMAREAILQAFAEQAGEVGSLDFSVADVAERAGVSQRTVYNYFESRDALIGAFFDWLDDRVNDQGGMVIPEVLADLPAALPPNFRIFEDKSDIAAVLARSDTAARSTPARQRRHQAFESAVARAYPEMEERQRKMLAALMRQIASVRNWYHMTREHGLSTEQAGVVSSWALEQLIAALDRGETTTLEDSR